MKLYTKTVCPKCLWVKSELVEASVAFDMVNIDEDEAARQTITDAGIMAVPVLEVDGELLTAMPQILAAIERVS